MTSKSRGALEGESYQWNQAETWIKVSKYAGGFTRLEVKDYSKAEHSPLSTLTLYLDTARLCAALEEAE